MSRLAFAVCVFAVSVTVEAAVTNYVAADATGASNGTSWADAYTDIQTAIANSSTNGDYILIKQGTYSITNQLYIGSGTNLTMRGGYVGAGSPGTYTNDASMTVVERASGSIRILRIDNAGGTIQGMTFKGGNPGAALGGGLYLDGATTAFTNCIIRNNTTSTHGGGAYVTGGGTTFDNCEIRDNTANGYVYGGGIYISGANTTFRSCVLRGNYGGRGGAARFDGSTVARLFNCLIVNNQALETTIADGLQIDPGTLVSIESCTVAGNSGRGIVGTSGTTITNSIIWNNGDDISGSSISLSYSCVQDTNDTGPGVIHGDPQFEYGYYLGSGSSCTNAGAGNADTLGLDTKYAQAGTNDTGILDLGYHYDLGYSISNPDLYVATTGSDTNSGTSVDAPFRTITHALSQAEVGCTIHVAAGSYTNGSETFPLTNATEAVRIIGDNATNTIINAAGANQRVMYVNELSSDGLLKNLTFRGGSSSGGSGLYLNKTSISIEDCIFRDNTANSGGGMYIDGGRPIFDNCRISDNAAPGFAYSGGMYINGATATFRSCIVKENYGGRGGAIRFTYGAVIRMFNCLIVNNVAEKTGWADGLHIDAGSLVSIENCTIAGNAEIGVIVGGSGTAITNSIIWNNGDDISGSAVSLSYSCVQDTNDTGPGVIHGDPQFEYGYYLGSGSSCTNAGVGNADTLGLDTKYAQASTNDTGIVDLGYHYDSGYSISNPDLYVAVTGSDTNSGTSVDSPFRTITHALSQAEVGCTIHVAAGSYTNGSETFPLTNATEAVRIIGDNAANTIIDAAGANQRVMYVKGLGAGGLLKNLTFRGANCSSHGSGLYLDKTTIGIEDCVFRDNTAAANYSGAGVFVYGGVPTFDSCRITGNTAGGSGSGGGMYISAASATFRSCIVGGNSGGRGGAALLLGTGITRMFNCLIFSNTASDAAYADGVHIDADTPVSIENCTIADNNGIGITGISSTTITNSIIWNNGDDLVSITDTSKVGYCCIQDGDFNGTNGCVSLDPAFVDTMYYHLKSTGGDYRNGYFSGGSWSRSTTLSPLINLGDPASDYSNEPYHHGKRINMGAYGNTTVASKTPIHGTVIMIN